MSYTTTLLSGLADLFRRMARDIAQLELSVGALPEMTKPLVDERGQYFNSDIAAGVVAVALQEWEKDIAEPPGSNWEEINKYICGPDGLGWLSADTKNLGKATPYTRDLMFSWCGAFVAYCLGVNGLSAEIRKKIMPSCYRLYANFKDTDRYIPRRMHIEPGDIVVVGNEHSPIWGAHITLCTEVISRTGIETTIRTIEGNAKGDAPNGLRHEGVITRQRSTVPDTNGWYIKHIYRMLDEDFEAA